MDIFSHARPCKCTVEWQGQAFLELDGCLEVELWRPTKRCSQDVKLAKEVASLIFVGGKGSADRVLRLLSRPYGLRFSLEKLCKRDWYKGSRDDGPGARHSICPKSFGRLAQHRNVMTSSGNFPKRMKAHRPQVSQSLRSRAHTRS